jgi:thiamine-monophosphate kinase
VLADSIPRGAALAEQPRLLQQECVLAGGDDYELLFTAPAAQHARVRAVAGAQAACIGHITAEPGLRVVDAAGAPVATPWRGFDHFAAA